MSSAKFLVCFNFQSALMLLKAGENVVRVSNSFDLGETPKLLGVSSGSKLFAYGTIVVLGGLRVNISFPLLSDTNSRLLLHLVLDIKFFTDTTYI